MLKVSDFSFELMKNNTLLVLGFSIALFALSSCLKVEVLPNEPVIEFRSFTVYPDSAVLVFAFEDGDGNVGLNEADTLPPFEVDGDNYFNLYCFYYEQQNSEWVFYDDLATPFYYRVPRVTPTGQNPTLKGEMSVTFTPPYYLLNTGFDTCRFEVQLVDRSLNRSNRIVSSSFLKP